MNAISRHWEMVRHALAEEKARARSVTRVEETAFLPAALEIVERPVSPTARWTARTLLLLLVLICLWLVFGKVDVVASASGRLVPADNVKLIQSAQGGVVRAIHVRDGQQVRAGQVLIELDPTVSAAEVAQARQALQTAELNAARARAILAALDGHGLQFASPPGVSAEIAANHLALARARLAEIEAGSSGASSNRDAAQAARNEALIDAARLNETLPLLDEQIAANETLLARGYVSRLRVIEMRRQRLSAARDRDRALETARRATAQLAAAGSAGTQGRSEARGRILTELATAEADAGVRREELNKALQRSRSQQLRAPVDGAVAQLVAHTIGGVIEPTRPIMVVVPANAPLVMEARLLNRDAGFVSVGQSVAVKVEAFPFTRFGTAAGRVESISSDAIEDQRLGLVYVARVRLNEGVINRGDQVVRLAPGMAATADIRTGQRSLLHYLWDPISSSIESSLRER